MIIDRFANARPAVKLFLMLSILRDAGQETFGEERMSTIRKALTLLDLVAGLDRDIGLADLARLAALDKATARRFLVELEKHGFVEQDGETGYDEITFERV